MPDHQTVAAAFHAEPSGNEIVVRLDRRPCSPKLRQADLPAITVPWRGDRQLRYEFA